MFQVFVTWQSLILFFISFIPHSILNRASVYSRSSDLFSKRKLEGQLRFWRWQCGIHVQDFSQQKQTFTKNQISLEKNSWLLWCIRYQNNKVSTSKVCTCISLQHLAWPRLAHLNSDFHTQKCHLGLTYLLFIIFRSQGTHCYFHSSKEKPWFHAWAGVLSLSLAY